jgi:hypothetical protein
LFGNHFKASNSTQPNLDGVPFPSVSDDQNIALTAPFSIEEIHKVVLESDGNKSPGPDGFNFAFIKSYWDLLKADIRILFDQFHGIGKLPKSVLSYFVSLIPKVDSPFGLGDFRPISLLGCLYKLIAKVLAGRLAKVMNSLIALNQSAFIKGRNLVDGVVVVNEMVDLARRTGKECIIFKVDFEKAYCNTSNILYIYFSNFLDYSLGNATSTENIFPKSSRHVNCTTVMLFTMSPPVS